MSCFRHDMDEKLVFGRLATTCHLFHVSKSFTAFNQYGILVLYFIFVDVPEICLKKENVIGMVRITYYTCFFCNSPP